MWQHVIIGAGHGVELLCQAQQLVAYPSSSIIESGTIEIETVLVWRSSEIRVRVCEVKDDGGEWGGCGDACGGGGHGGPRRERPQKIGHGGGAIRAVVLRRQLPAH